MSFNLTEFAKKVEEDGYCVVENVLSAEFIAETKNELQQAIQKEQEYHGTSSYNDYGMVLLCALYGGNFIKLFDNKLLTDCIEAVLGEGSIVYAYTSSSMPPNKSNYSRRIHVDSPRIIPGYMTNLGVTIALDDFTAENGATYFLPKSHHLAEPPAEEYFYANAKRFIAKAGSVWFFNARTWHAGGDNKTSEWRHGLTLNMCRPYMKQRLDIPRAMAHMDLNNVSEKALQKLGFLAQTPASYDEYYAPPEKRKYRQKYE
ncbi:MAG: phytanoyl-CoA dioxygenase family protein [Chitinophagaceae bacterium]|nr:phytanoyl-CoA dioxygenase family protein [Chitinophagaceae bacterium]